jgi:UDP-glucose 4-epimerase
MSKILVTGGTGYIGSHTLVDLIDNGFEVISADNFCNSDASSLKGVERITGKKIKNYKVDLANLAATRKIFEQNKDLSGVIHFAALKSVGDSVYQPLRYFQNNLDSLLNIVQCMTDYKVQNLIFSSSCSVYGQSDQLPVTEETPLKPVESPYARTKVIGEEILRDFCFTNPNFNAILLRYFNPAGAHPTSIIGENPSNIANNLVPVITETAYGKRPMMTVFGTDYPTRDGSCIRDYIHVMDIANAHVKAVQYLEQKKNKSNTETFNLGIGEGVSVLEAIKAFEKVTGVDLNYRIGNKRAGDVGAVYADNTKATTLLGWQPKYDIDAIMQSAWAWEQKRSK